MNHFFRDNCKITKLKRSPLVGKYLEEYAVNLKSQGYSRENARSKIRAIAKFGFWLTKNKISVENLTQESLRRYCKTRKLSGKAIDKSDSHAVHHFVKYLAQANIIAPLPVVPTAYSETVAICEAFAKYLANERSLSGGTIDGYQLHARRFLEYSGVLEIGDVAKIEHADIANFLSAMFGQFNLKTIKKMTTALRAFFRYVFFLKYTKGNLALMVPAVASWTTRKIRAELARDHVEKVLACCEIESDVDRRDFAVLLLLARLGLRAGEVVAMTLDDIDWHSATLRVHGKGKYLAPMPIPADVGKALASYIAISRPQSESRRIFLRAIAPVGPIANSGCIGAIVLKALARAGLEPRGGAHQFRHGLACEALRRGASLPEIAELLRHRDPETTSVYAKVDFISLKSLGLEWPGGAV